MNAFDHVMTLVSFVFALAIAHLLTCVIALIRAGARVRYSFAHAAWMLVSLAAIIAWWLAMWDFRVLESWDVGTILFTLFGAIFTYVFTGLVCPEVPAEGRIDLDEFHFGRRREYLAAYLVGTFVAIAYSFYYGLVDHVAEQYTQVVALAPQLAVTLAAYVIPNRRAQNICGAAMLALLLMYFHVAQAPLQ